MGKYQKGKYFCCVSEQPVSKAIQVKPPTGLFLALEKMQKKSPEILIKQTNRLSNSIRDSGRSEEPEALT
jgi:hypothetical protein